MFGGAISEFVFANNKQIFQPAKLASVYAHQIFHFTTKLQLDINIKEFTKYN